MANDQDLQLNSSHYSDLNSKYFQNYNLNPNMHIIIQNVIDTLYVFKDSPKFTILRDLSNYLDSVIDRMRCSNDSELKNSQIYFPLYTDHEFNNTI